MRLVVDRKEFRELLEMVEKYRKEFTDSTPILVGILQRLGIEQEDE